MTRMQILGRVAAGIFLVVITVAFITLTLYARSLSDRINQQASNNLHNRVKNVLTWCSAINTDRSTTRAYIQGFRVKNPQIPALPLPQLPCKQIADRTLKSGGH